MAWGSAQRSGRTLSRCSGVRFVACGRTSPPRRTASSRTSLRSHGSSTASLRRRARSCPTYFSAPVAATAPKPITETSSASLRAASALKQTSRAPYTPMLSRERTRSLVSSYFGLIYLWRAPTSKQGHGSAKYLQSTILCAGESPMDHRRSSEQLRPITGDRQGSCQ